MDQIPFEWLVEHKHNMILFEANEKNEVVAFIYSLIHIGDHLNFDNFTLA